MLAVAACAGRSAGSPAPARPNPDTPTIVARVPSESGPVSTGESPACPEVTTAQLEPAKVAPDPRRIALDQIYAADEPRHGGTSAARHDVGEIVLYPGSADLL